MREVLEDADNVRGLIEIVDDDLAQQLDFTELTPMDTSFISDNLPAQEGDV